MDRVPESGGKLTLMELKERLRGLVDVNKQLELTLQDHARWGVLEMFQERGMVEDIVGYEQLLRSATIDEGSLDHVESFYKTNGRDAAKLIINPGTLSTKDYYDALFVRSGLVPEEVLKYFSRALGAISNGNPIEPSISFVPTAKEYQCAGSAVEVAGRFTPNLMCPIDPVTDWLFWRRDLDKNIRRLLADLRGGGALRQFPNFQRISDWFQFAARKQGNVVGEYIHPKWTDLDAENYKVWTQLYLQAAGPLGLPLSGQHVYSMYPGSIHGESGLALGMGLIPRMRPNAMLPFLNTLSQRELARVEQGFGTNQSGIDIRNFTETLVPEPVFLAPDRDDPWVRTRVIF